MQKENVVSRISQEELAKITGRQRPAAQLRWFVDHFGARIPCDDRGPIITQAAFEALVAKGCGLRAANDPPRPTLHLTRKAS